MEIKEAVGVLLDLEAILDKKDAVHSFLDILCDAEDIPPKECVEKLIECWKSPLYNQMKEQRKLKAQEIRRQINE